MKLLAFVIVTLIIAVSAALLAQQDPGYMLIDIGGWTVETTVVMALVVLALVFAMLYYALRLLINTLHARRDLQRWHQQRQIRKANQALSLGLIQLAEGNWAEAEKRVLKHVNREPTAMLNYLAAARAAQEQGAYERRDKYLNLAHQSMPSADIAVGLTQAELQLSQKQIEQALATLRRLQQLAPQHKKVLKALAAVYVKLGDWNHLIDMIPDLRKRKVLPPEETERLERMAYLELFQRLELQDHQGLQALWYRIPKTLQGNEALLSTYIQRLIKQGKSDITEPLIRNALRQYWSESLVHLYGLIDAADVNSQIAHAESWLKSHENNATLLLTLGRLCLRAGLWGKARAYLEASVGAAGLPEAYNELGHLLEKLGEKEKAIECFRNGLSNAPGCELIISHTAATELEHKSGNNQGLLPESSIVAR